MQKLRGSCNSTRFWRPLFDLNLGFGALTSTWTVGKNIWAIISRSQMHAYHANGDCDALKRMKWFSIDGLPQTKIGTTKDKTSQVESHKATRRLRDSIPMVGAFRSKIRFTLADCPRNIKARFQTNIRYSHV